jgi:hypothetical protein
MPGLSYLLGVSARLKAAAIFCHSRIIDPADSTDGHKLGCFPLPPYWMPRRPPEQARPVQQRHQLNSLPPLASFFHSTGGNRRIGLSCRGWIGTGRPHQVAAPEPRRLLTTRELREQESWSGRAVFLACARSSHLFPTSISRKSRPVAIARYVLFFGAG